MTAPDRTPPSSETVVPGPQPGFERIAVFTSLDDEYAALRRGAALVDRSARVRMLFGGAQAAATLTGLVTNDVLALRPGSGQYAAALTNKGKIISDVRIFARNDDILLDLPEAAGAGFVAMTRKYVNPRLARYADVSAVLRTIGVYGPRAHAALAQVLEGEGATATAAAALRGLGMHQHLSFGVGGANVVVARVPDFGVEGFDCFAPVEVAGELWSLLERARATPAGIRATEVARVEAGRPLWGIDMNEETLAQEANFDSLDGLSYTKGCYTGQETVARVHFRGHVNRTLRGIEGEAEIPAFASLYDGEREVGEMRSSVLSPRLGPIGLAMLRRDVADGAALTARFMDSTWNVRVHELPFG